MKISILTVDNHPFAGLAIMEIRKKFNIFNIILDKKRFSDKDFRIWNERTLGKVKYININTLNNIKKKKVSSHNSKLMLRHINKHKIDLLINLGTPRILSNKIVNAASIGVLNCHPGILPQYRGCTCVEWALYNNDPVGNTCHLMTNKIDSGPIILDKKINLSSVKNYNEVRIKIYLQSISLIISSLKLLKIKKISYFKSKNGGKYYKPIGKIKFNKMLERFK